MQSSCCPGLVELSELQRGSRDFNCGEQDEMGVCKLTGAVGKYVDAHLIPKALTKQDAPGAPFIQSGGGSAPVRRWSSWYDRELVIRAGEDILAEFDDWAIRELRKHKLVWSGWGPLQRLTESHNVIDNSPYGLREIKGIDPKKLRLFFLSLLWRGAATRRPEFSEVDVPPEDIEQLRQMLINKQPEPFRFYPITLTQLSTMGEVHNLTPIFQVKNVPGFGLSEDRAVPMFRYYFDGLIAHIHCRPFNEAYTTALRHAIVGAEDRLLVTTVTYEDSFERINLEALKIEAYRDWPHVIAKLLPDD